MDVAGALLGWQALDHAAHLGGAVVGIAYFYALRAVPHPLHRSPLLRHDVNPNLLRFMAAHRQMDGLRKWDNYGTADLPGGHT